MTFIGEDTTIEREREERRGKRKGERMRKQKAGKDEGKEDRSKLIFAFHIRFELTQWCVRAGWYQSRLCVSLPSSVLNDVL